MIQFITIIHVIVCVLLVIVVLLQQGKKDGMGSAFGGGGSSVFGARGAETFLEKFTKILALVFMCTSLPLVYISSKDSTGSLLSNEKPASESPATTGETKAPSENTTVPAQTPLNPPATEKANTKPTAPVPAK